MCHIIKDFFIRVYIYLDQDFVLKLVSIIIIVNFFLNSI